METKIGNKIQTDFSIMGPTIFELWVIETELWVMESTYPNSPLVTHAHFAPHVSFDLNF